MFSKRDLVLVAVGVGAGALLSSALLLQRAPERASAMQAEQSTLPAHPAQVAAPVHPREPADERTQGTAQGDLVRRLQAVMHAMPEQGATSSALERRVDELEDELDRLKHGVVQEWPAKTEANARFQPEAFRATMRKVFRDCGLDDSRAKIDCDEPPCLVSLHNPGYAWNAVVECPAWVDAFTRNAMVHVSEIDCGGGKAQVNTIAPYWEEYLNVGEASTREERSNRVASRFEQASAGMCDKAEPRPEAGAGEER